MYDELAHLQFIGNCSHRAHERTNWDDQCEQANALQEPPIARPPGNLFGYDGALDWEKDCKWPEADGANNAHQGIEERKQ